MMMGKERVYMAPTTVRRRRISVSECPWDGGIVFYHIRCPQGTRGEHGLNIEEEDVDDVIAALQELRAQKEAE